MRGDQPDFLPCSNSHLIITKPGGTAIRRRMIVGSTGLRPASKHAHYYGRPAWKRRPRAHADTPPCEKPRRRRLRGRCRRPRPERPGATALTAPSVRGAEAGRRSRHRARGGRRQNKRVHHNPRPRPAASARTRSRRRRGRRTALRRCMPSSLGAGRKLRPLPDTWPSSRVPDRVRSCTLPRSMRAAIR